MRNFLLTLHLIPRFNSFVLNFVEFYENAFPKLTPAPTDSTTGSQTAWVSVNRF